MFGEANIHITTRVVILPECTSNLYGEDVNLSAMGGDSFLVMQVISFSVRYASVLSVFFELHMRCLMGVTPHGDRRDACVLQSLTPRMALAVLRNRCIMLQAASITSRLLPIMGYLMLGLFG